MTRASILIRKTQGAYQRHRGLTALLVAAALVHFAAWVAYWPGLWYSDSVSYADLAVHGGISPTRQMAYPWIWRGVMFVVGQTNAAIAFMTAAQHLAALGVGVLIYAMLRRLGAVTWLALVGAAVFLLDAFSLSVEQTLLSEAFYTLCLTASFALIVLFKRDFRALFFSGLLLAAAVWLRSAGLFAVPAWALYVLWSTRAWRPALLAFSALALPLLLYMTLYWQVTGVFGFTQTKGWFMYGRTAEIANCKSMDIPRSSLRLCPKQPPHPGAAFYIWDFFSPAQRVYKRAPGGDPERLEKFDRRLGQFAKAAIKDNPYGYAKLVVEDFGRFFQPGLMLRGDNDDLTTTFGRYNAPENLQLPPPGSPIRTYKHYVTPMRWPAPVLEAYSRVIHLPRLPLAFLLFASLAGVVLPSARRKIEHPAEVALLSGAAFSILIGHAATSDFTVRYLIPTVPLLLAGGIPGSRWVWLGLRRPARRIRDDLPSPVLVRGDDRGTYRPHAAPGHTRDKLGSAG